MDEPISGTDDHHSRRSFYHVTRSRSSLWVLLQVQIRFCCVLLLPIRTAEQYT